MIEEDLKTNVRLTSIECYRQIVADKLLSKKRLEIYKILLRMAPCTSGEAFTQILSSDNTISQSRARFTELRELGVIEEVGRRKCKITGRMAIEWGLTDMLPTKPQKKSQRPRNYIKVVKYLIDVAKHHNKNCISIDTLEKSLKIDR